MIQDTADEAFTADLLRGHTDTIVLGVLRRHDSYGFEIYKSIREATGGAYEIKEATLYASYRRLVRDGLAEAYWGDESQSSWPPRSTKCGSRSPPSSGRRSSRGVHFARRRRTLRGRRAHS